jgi:outer membrane immunogenic protein
MRPLPLRPKPLLAAISLLTVFTLPLLAAAQAAVRDHASASLDLGVNYIWLHAIAPAGQCGCFSANGGSGTVALNFGGAAHDLSLLADLSGSHSSNLNGTSQTITIADYLFGVRYTLHGRHRFAPYGQALIGASHETSNYAYVLSTTSVAFSGGGGATLRIAPHLGWNVFQADWIHSDLPNGSNNRQNDVRLGTGIFLTIHGH